MRNHRLKRTFMYKKKKKHMPAHTFCHYPRRRSVACLPTEQCNSGSMLDAGSCVHTHTHASFFACFCPIHSRVKHMTSSWSDDDKPLIMSIICVCGKQPFHLKIPSLVEHCCLYYFLINNQVIIRLFLMNNQVILA